MDNSQWKQNISPQKTTFFFFQMKCMIALIRHLLKVLTGNDFFFLFAYLYEVNNSIHSMATLQLCAILKQGLIFCLHCFHFQNKNIDQHKSNSYVPLKQIHFISFSHIIFYNSFFQRVPQIHTHSHLPTSFTYMFKTSGYTPVDSSFGLGARLSKINQRRSMKYYVQKVGVIANKQISHIS